MASAGVYVDQLALAVEMLIFQWDGTLSRCGIYGRRRR